MMLLAESRPVFLASPPARLRTTHTENMQQSHMRRYQLSTPLVREGIRLDRMRWRSCGQDRAPSPRRREPFRSAGLAARDTRSAVGKHDNDARLRETHRIFLQAGSSYKAAASEFNLHFNALKYRVDRAIERRDRPITDDRLDVEIALLIATGPAPRIQRRYKTDCLRCSSVAAQ